MNPKTISLDRIQVAKPCPANWEDMKGNDSVRFCSQCRLNVYNLSAMTKAEAEKLVMQSEDRLCVRFYRRADGTMLTQDCPVGLRAFNKRVSKIAATAFSTLLSLLTGNLIECVASAQGLKVGQSKPKIKRTDLPLLSSSFEGRIVDVVESVIPVGQVTLINEQTKREWTTKVSDTGRFRFQGMELGEYTLKVSSPGFKASSFSGIRIGANELLDIEVMLEVGDTTMGILVVTETVKTSDHSLPTQINRKEKPREQ